LKQKDLEDRYRENGYTKDSLCLVTDIINLQRLTGGLSDTALDNFMKNTAGSYVNTATGTVNDFPGMSKALAELAGDSSYYDYVYPESDGKHKVVMNEDDFKKSEYQYGIGEYYTIGGSYQNICHYELIRRDPWQVYNPGVSDYSLYQIRPVRRVKIAGGK
jgi:hypothetical protein